MLSEIVRNSSSAVDFGKRVLILYSSLRCQERAQMQCECIAVARRFATWWHALLQRQVGLPSSRGLGLRPFTAATRVRIPLGVPLKNTMALWRSWLARRPVTAEVAGSSPVRVAILNTSSGWSWCFCFWLVVCWVSVGAKSVSDSQDSDRFLVCFPDDTKQTPMVQLSRPDEQKRHHPQKSRAAHVKLPNFIALSGHFSGHFCYKRGH